MQLYYPISQFIWASTIWYCNFHIIFMYHALHFPHQCITVRPLLSVCPLVHLLHFFYILLKDLVVLFLHRILICNTWHYTSRQNFMEKYEKILSKMYKHLVQRIVQQQVQQKVHNNYVAPLIKQFVFTKLVESLS